MDAAATRQRPAGRASAGIFHALVGLVVAMLGETATGQFYVHGVRGDDGNPGTIARPFRTIQRAVDAAAMQPGHDTVIVLPTGKPYAGGVLIEDHSGGLTLQGFGHHQGPVELEGGSVGIDVSFSDPVQIERLTVRGATDGIRATFAAVRLVHVTSTGNNRHGLLIGMAAVAVKESSFSGNGAHGIHSPLIGNPLIQLSGVELDGNGGAGMWAQLAVVTAVDCRCRGNVGPGMVVLESYADLDGLLLADNGMGMRASIIGTITRSAFEGNRGNGLEIGLGAAEITECAFVDNEGDGLVVGDLGDLVLERSLLVRNDGNGLVLGDHDVSMTDCLVVHNHGNGIVDQLPMFQRSHAISRSGIAWNQGAGILGWSGSPPALTDVRFFHNRLGDLVLQ